MTPDEGSIIDNFTELFAAIDLLCERAMIQPALILLYSAIDAAAWLDVSGDGDVTRQDFVRWVDAYLLPGAGLACTALELYGARCGMLHSLTAFSSLSRNGAVRTLGYARGIATADDFNETVRLIGKPNMVGVHIDDLRRALKTAFQRFLDDAAAEPARWSRVVARASKLFAHIPTIAVTETLAELRARDV